MKNPPILEITIGGSNSFNKKKYKLFCYICNKIEKM